MIRIFHERSARQVLLATPTGKRSDPLADYGLGGVIAFQTWLGPVLVWSHAVELSQVAANGMLFLDFM